MCARGKDEGISPCHLGPHVRGIDGAYTVAHLEYDGRILGEHGQQLVKRAHALPAVLADPHARATPVNQRLEGQGQPISNHHGHGARAHGLAEAVVESCVSVRYQREVRVLQLLVVYRVAVCQHCRTKSLLLRDCSGLLGTREMHVLSARDLYER